MTFNIIIRQIWLFHLTHIWPRCAWAVDEKCRARHAGKEMTDPLWPMNKHLTVWSSQWRQPLNGSSEPSQNDSGNTGKACWEHWCLFSSQPLSITRPCGHHHFVCFPASLERPGHLGSAAQSFWILKPIFMLPLINRDGLECKQAFFDWWHRQHVSRLKLDGIHELHNPPQTTATELND